MKSLDPARRRALRAMAHHLHPVVSVGTHGLTPAVLHEIDVNLLAHELVKLRVHSDDREERQELFVRICSELDAAPVQHVGKVLVIYRERVDEEAPPAATKRKGQPRSSTRAPRKAEPQVLPKIPRKVASTIAAKKTPRLANAATRRTRDATTPREARAPQGKHPPKARRRRG